ncbi:hypothetical protein F2P81_023703 [Scophthalmus maximus]|uniref:Uncharacterized protein n=1 Tax=Scophthalmus maximus TaxID=52904 RepID=A0A6A4RMI3_SCOMX|nr:hypothetical protein F2P81_023703 [Scophthalmus maximus]
MPHFLKRAVELCATHPTSSKGTRHDRERNSSNQLLRPEEGNMRSIKSLLGIYEDFLNTTLEPPQDVSDLADVYTDLNVAMLHEREHVGIR